MAVAADVGWDVDSECVSSSDVVVVAVGVVRAGWYSLVVIVGWIGSSD